jgi:outer membrane protein assembly factor BamA
LLKFKLTYILPILAIVIVACKQTKYVPDGEYLLKKNTVIQSGDKLDKDDLSSIIRQQPNYKRLGVKWKLMAYNSIDSAKVAEKRIRKNQNLREKNRKRLKREDRINGKRIQKAKNKGKSMYTHKRVILKDTLEPRMFLREWYKYKIGEPPVVFDSILYNKTLEQMNAFLRRKGYYYGSAQAFVDYKENKKCKVTYEVTTGERYFVDSTYLVCENEDVKEAYDAFVLIQHDPPLLGQPFDSEEIDDFRADVAKFMRDSSFYGFSSNHITFLADTNKLDMTVDLGIIFGDRRIQSSENRDSLISITHRKTFVKDVYFHIADSSKFEGNFKQYMEDNGFSLYNGPFLNTIDTLYYDREEMKKRLESDESRMAIFTYNTEPFIKPSVLEMQNYLEKGHQYKEKYTEASYSSLLRMGLFRAIKTDLVEVVDTNLIDVHYYLSPTKKQSYSFQPRATNSNGYLGLSASINYSNRNLFRGAERLTFSISGGFESQPPVFEKLVDGTKVKTADRSFNIFEIGPSVKLQMPGLFPIRNSKISKRRRPETVISAAYNYQKRPDFVRGTFQMNYQWQFIFNKTSLFHLGFPGVSVIKFVNIDKQPDFETLLNDLGDEFLLNAYSNQFIWQDWKFRYEFNIKDKPNRKGNAQLYFSTEFDPAGNILSAFRNYQDTIDNGQYALAGVAYSQFARIDNELIFSKPLGKERSFNLKFLAGGGLPYGNTSTSMPYDYSFFAGGANDNRGWKARELGPGGYKYYLDTIRRATQIGDVRIGGSMEYRFAINSFFKGAVFVDAGNIWTRFYDENRPGSQFTNRWWRQVAVATGVGLRMDLEYFIIRVDFGVPVRNPALPDGENWFFQKKDDYIQEGKDEFGDPEYLKYLPSPYIPNIHFGIGYPF